MNPDVDCLLRLIARIVRRMMADKKTLDKPSTST